MKSAIKPIGIIALVAVIGFVLTATLVSCGDDSGNNNTPGGQTPDGNTPGGGEQLYITLTDIPAAYNGKYIYFVTAVAIGEGDNAMLGNIYGCQNFTLSDPGTNGRLTKTTTCIQIANERVVLPMWYHGTLVSTGEHSVTKYSGGGEQYIFSVFYIEDSPILIEYPNYSLNQVPLAWFQFDTGSIPFTNGSVTVSGNDAGWFYETP